jgi:hypothetical protein
VHSRLRVTVGTILGLLASGRSDDQILEAYPYLEREDIRSALAYAACEPGDRGSAQGIVRVLLDMNLSPVWIRFLEKAGIAAVQWSIVGTPTAEDGELMAWARLNACLIFLRSFSRRSPLTL